MFKIKNIFKKKKAQQLPSFLRPFLWSYDLEKMDKEKHKQIIIKNVLDFGTKQAIDWLRENYSKKEIQQAIKNSIKSDWSKKSINLWSLVYEVEPKDSRG